MNKITLFIIHTPFYIIRWYLNKRQQSKRLFIISISFIKAIRWNMTCKYWARAFSVLGDLPEDPEEAWSITRDTILTTAAENIPVKRDVRRPWLTTETMDIIDQKKEARLKGNYDEWKRLKGVYKARSKVDLELFLREISRWSGIRFQEE